MATSAWLTASGSPIRGTGIVRTTADVDYFAFTTGAGMIDLRVDVAAVGPNLNARLELRSASGALIVSNDPADALTGHIAVTVQAGTYYVVVKSHGTYGDVGQYTLTGTLSNPRDTTGPYVLSSTFQEYSGGQYRRLRVTFNEPIAVSTFTPADVRLTTASGGVITPTGIVAVAGSSNRIFDVIVSLTGGTYTLESGPGIQDLAGNLMDQDRDGFGGEWLQDRYRITMNLPQLPPLW